LSIVRTFRALNVAGRPVLENARAGNQGFLKPKI